MHPLVAESSAKSVNLSFVCVCGYIMTVVHTCKCIQTQNVSVYYFNLPPITTLLSVLEFQIYYVIIRLNVLLKVLTLKLITRAFFFLVQ